MRVLEALVLAVLGFLLGYAAGRGTPTWPVAVAARDVHAAASPAAVVAALLRRPAGAAGAEHFVSTPLHERLAQRAHAGDTVATLELLQLLETCTLRDETRDFMRNHLDVDADDAPACDSPEACRGVERVYDEFQGALAQWRDAEADCRDVPEGWLRTRGRWLEQLAAAGDTEARTCYALTGAELAP
ncbi:MAG TPA: hypothetical protein VFO79_00370, partial [Xanthomonadales bacterium]|nr:hypothetical protein [Xanthomonadales bacterium]